MYMWAYYTQAAPLLSNVAVLCVLAMLICSVCTFFEGMLDDCSKPELENMVLRQMAFESIFTAEKLAFSDEEFQREYEEAKREFEESKSEFDDARLQEQVTENLKVCLFATVMVAAVEVLTFTVGFAFCLIELLVVFAACIVAKMLIVCTRCWQTCWKRKQCSSELCLSPKPAEYGAT